MVNIDFAQPIRDPAGQPLTDAHGTRITVGSVALTLLQAHIGATPQEAHAALALARKIQHRSSIVTMLPPDLGILKKALSANHANLPAVQVATVAQTFRWVGSNA